MRVEAKLEELGLTLPEAPKLPPGVELSFAWVRVYRTAPTSRDMLPKTRTAP
jgi:hypothetical protein